jgi:hypothetical protein
MGAIAAVSLLATPAVSQAATPDPATTCPSAAELLSALTNDATAFEAAGSPTSLADLSCALPYATVTTPVSDDVDSSLVLFKYDSTKGWTMLNVASGAVCDGFVPAAPAATLNGCAPNDSSGDDLPDLPQDEDAVYGASGLSTVGGQITRAEVMSRAQGWLDNQPGPYTKTGQKSWDPTHTRMYRRDCSGYTGMAWHLNGDNTTHNLLQVSDRIARADLKAGDALLDVAHHVIIFKNWKSDRKHFTYYSFGSTPVKMRTASIDSGRIDSHPAADYIPVRYNKIIDPTPPTPTPPPTPRRATADFDGDGASEIGVYRAGAGQWNILSVKRNVQLYGSYPYGGDASDIPLVGDFDKDGYDDIALYRKSTGQWNIKSVKRNVQLYASYEYGGDPSDIPLVGDFDKDGYDDIALYRKGAGQWHIKSVKRNVQLYGSYPYGGDASDIPLVGDFDKDGYDDIALYRKGAGQWHILSVKRNVQLYGSYEYGGDPSDIPLVGDYDGDGYDDIALYRKGAGQWHILSLKRGVQLAGSYPYGGDPSDIPINK